VGLGFGISSGTSDDVKPIDEPTRKEYFDLDNKAYGRPFWTAKVEPAVVVVRNDGLAKQISEALRRSVGLGGTSPVGGSGSTRNRQSFEMATLHLALN
jgi:hypothetical protein